MTKAILLADLWALLLLVAFFSLPRLTRRCEAVAPKIKVAWLWIACIALLVRLIPDWILPVGASYDIESFEIVANLTLEGEDVYSSPSAVNRHPYLPFQLYWMAFAKGASELTGMSFVRVVRLLPILADVAIALLIFKMAGPADKLIDSLAYAVNPVTVFVSAYHGQFDAIPILFIILALYFQSRSTLGSWGFLGFAILTKSWPVLTLPSLLRGLELKRKSYVFLLIIAIPLAGVVLYAILFQGNIISIVRTAIGYNHGIGIWGYTYLIRLVSLLSPFFGLIFQYLFRIGRYLTLLGLLIVWLVRAKDEDAIPGLLTILVTFFAITHAFSIQYLIWLVPVAILAHERGWLRRYTLAAFSYMFLAYSTLILSVSIDRLMPLPQADLFIIMLFGLPVWLVVVFWAYERLVKRRALPDLVPVPQGPAS